MARVPTRSPQGEEWPQCRPGLLKEMGGLSADPVSSRRGVASVPTRSLLGEGWLECRPGLLKERGGLSADPVYSRRRVALVPTRSPLGGVSLVNGSA